MSLGSETLLVLNFPMEKIHALENKGIMMVPSTVKQDASDPHLRFNPIPVENNRRSTHKSRRSIIFISENGRAIKRDQASNTPISSNIPTLSRIKFYLEGEKENPGNNPGVFKRLSEAINNKLPDPQNGALDFAGFNGIIFDIVNNNKAVLEQFKHIYIHNIEGGQHKITCLLKNNNRMKWLSDKEEEHPTVKHIRTELLPQPLETEVLTLHKTSISSWWQERNSKTFRQFIYAFTAIGLVLLLLPFLVPILLSVAAPIFAFMPSISLGVSVSKGLLALGALFFSSGVVAFLFNKYKEFSCGLFYRYKGEYSPTDFNQPKNSISPSSSYQNSNTITSTQSPSNSSQSIGRFSETSTIKPVLTPSLDDDEEYESPLFPSEKAPNQPPLPLSYPPLPPPETHRLRARY